MGLWVDDDLPILHYDDCIKDNQEAPVISGEVLMRLAEEKPGMEYSIRVKGCLPELDWSSWFGDLTILTDEIRGETILKGMIVDASELYGLISRLRNLGLILISVEPTASELTQK